MNDDKEDIAAKAGNYILNLICPGSLGPETPVRVAPWNQCVPECELEFRCSPCGGFASGVCAIALIEFELLMLSELLRRSAPHPVMSAVWAYCHQQLQGRVVPV